MGASGHAAAAGEIGRVRRGDRRRATQTSWRMPPWDNLARPVTSFPFNAVCSTLPRSGADDAVLVDAERSTLAGTHRTERNQTHDRDTAPIRGGRLHAMPTRQSVTGAVSVRSLPSSPLSGKAATPGPRPACVVRAPSGSAPLAHRPQSRGKPQQDQWSFGQTGCREPEPTARRSVDDLSDRA